MPYFIVRVKLPQEIPIMADNATEAEEKVKEYIEKYVKIHYTASEPLSPCQLGYACPPAIKNCGECAKKFKIGIDKE